MRTKMGQESFDDFQDRMLGMVQDKVAALYEHFDSVQIFTTRHDAHNGSLYYTAGAGNFPARYGQVKLWVKRAEDEQDG